MQRPSLPSRKKHKGLGRDSKVLRDHKPIALEEAIMAPAAFVHLHVACEGFVSRCTVPKAVRLVSVIQQGLHGQRNDQQDSACARSPSGSVAATGGRGCGTRGVSCSMPNSQARFVQLLDSRTGRHEILGQPPGAETLIPIARVAVASAILRSVRSSGSARRFDRTTAYSERW